MQHNLQDIIYIKVLVIGSTKKKNFLKKALTWEQCLRFFNTKLFK